MYDIDAGYAPTLRLVPPSTSHERLSHTIDRLHREQIEGPAGLAAEALRVAQRDVEAAHLRWVDAYAALQAAIAQSRPVPASDATLSASTDFWDHRHRVLSGTTPMIARSSGHIDRITAAAAGEIEDPAAGLRRERN
jgi:hypothetical protein